VGVDVDPGRRTEGQLLDSSRDPLRKLLKLGEQTPIQDRRKPLTRALETIRPLTLLHRSRSPARQARRNPIVVHRPGRAVYARQRTNDRLGLLVRAPLENVALFGGGDVFEHKHAAAGLAVARAAEALRDAVAQAFTHVAAKKQLALDLRRAILLDDE
jgi:hypothetical protein